MLFLGAIPVVLGLLAFSVYERKVAADRRIGIATEERQEGLVVTSVRPGLPADRAGVRAGDVLRALGGQPVRSEAEYDTLASSFRPGRETELALGRDGRRLVLAVTPGVPFPWPGFLGTTLAVLAYLAAGFWSLRRRPGVLKANLLAAFCVAVALELVLPNPVAKPVLATALLLGYYLLTGLQLGLELHLISTFLERRVWLTRHPWIVPVLYATGAFVALVPLVALSWSSEGARRFVEVLGLPAWCLAVTALLFEPILRHPDREGRRDAGIVLAGTIPWTGYVLISAALDASGIVLPAWAEPLEPWAVLCFPLAIALVLYRESARQEHVVLGLAEKIQRVMSLDEVSGFLRADLGAAFHPRSSFLFRREELPPEGSALLRLLEREGTVEVPDLRAGVPSEETGWLERLGIRLLVPLLGRDRDLVGLLALGEKSSEEPYTTRDRRVLQTIAGQIAMMIENARLHERVEEGRRVQREVLDRLGEGPLPLVKECPRCGRCFGPEAAVCPRDGAELAPSLPVERTIAGRYRLERLLGRGGMGAVYEGFDEQLRRPVALKILLPALFGDAEALRRFEREARISARLQHPNIVAVHDFGGTETGGAFLVMELLNGVSLRTVLQRQGALAPPTAARWLRQICAGVRAAHESRVVHRDLKPENLFIVRMEGEGEVVKVLDFGLAKAIGRPGGDGATSVTMPGTLLGTVSYMPPEQWNGQEVDERSDLFALGVIAFEAIAGEKPFRGSSPAEILHALLREEVRLPGEGPEVRRLEAVLRRCLARDPRQRLARVADLESELLPALEACPPLGPAAGRHEVEETRKLPSKRHRP